MALSVAMEDQIQNGGAGASRHEQTLPRPPDSHHRLSAAAVCLQRMLDDPDGVMPRWRTRGFVRCVERVRLDLQPIGSHAALAESYGREASRQDPLETAYALRWLELANGAARPPWSLLVRGH
jgi:hypothetical protein